MTLLERLPEIEDWAGHWLSHPDSTDKDELVIREWFDSVCKLLGAQSVDKMIEAIEARCCIRKLWRCNAGWGMMFVREYEDPPNRPRIPLPASSTDAHVSFRLKSAKWNEERKRREREATVVHGYHPTLEACVRAEYEVRVIKGEAP